MWPKYFQNFRQIFRKNLHVLILTSLGISFLNLTLPLYMLQIYDRIFRTENVNSLVLITIAAFVALVFMGILQSARGKLIENLNSLNELENQNIPVSHHVVTPVLDLMWSPLFIAMAFVLSFQLGLYMIFAFSFQVVSGVLMKLYKTTSQQELAGARRQFSILSQASENNRNFHQTKTGLGGKIMTLKDRQSFAHNVFSTLNVSHATFSQICRLLLQIGVLCLGALLVIYQNLSPGSVIAASILLNLVLTPLERFMATADKLKNLLESPEKEPIAFEQAYEGRLANIRLLNVTHIFPGMTRPLLHGVNMNFMAGQFIGITGPSGAGKSTLAKLFCGVETPRQGNVLFEFEDGKSFNIEPLLFSLGYMSERNHLIEGSIGENIGLHGQHNLGDIRKAARLAGIDQQIMSLPDQYETKNASLSAGVMQMLFFARTLYIDAQVLILDHPENALDIRFKLQLAQTLRNLKASNKTIILFSQSKSLLTIADQCFALRNGGLHQFEKNRNDVSIIPSTHYRYQHS